MLIKGIQPSNSICLHFNLIFFHLSFTLLGLQNDFALGRKKKRICQVRAELEQESQYKAGIHHGCLQILAELSVEDSLESYSRLVYPGQLTVILQIPISQLPVINWKSNWDAGSPHFHTYHHFLAQTACLPMFTFAHPQVGEQGLLREKKMINYTYPIFVFMGYSHKTLLYVINVPLKVKSPLCVETMECLRSEILPGISMPLLPNAYSIKIAVIIMRSNKCQFIKKYS